MTCFWDGILNALKYQYTDKNFENIFTKKTKNNPKDLILFFKKIIVKQIMFYGVIK